MSLDRINRIEDLLTAFISVKFENYLALYDFVEMHLEKVQKELEIKWDEFYDSENEDFDSYAEEHNLNEAYKFDNEFPNRMRYSGIIQTYSILEHYMKWLCVRLQKIEDSHFGLNDLKGNSDIEKGKLFLTKLYQVDFKKLEPEWTFINEMRTIRNQIIHKNGEVDISDREIYRIIKKHEDLGIMFEEIRREHNMIDDPEIEIKSKKLNEKFVSVVKSFFLKLFSEIKSAK